ncbi:MAG: IS200/IS605 family transposase [Deltaproteobacteria bacterium]|nr:IS200/IS605 family transposase [Deltaproteobacteria bacterium]
MEDYRKTSHSIYNIKYHFVWITKFRKPVLLGDVAIRVRELIREICKAMEIEIIKGHVSKDHVHLLLSVPPYHSASTVIKRIKGKTSRKLLRESRLLARQFWGRHLLARGYFVASSGNVTEEVIAQYIESQGQMERPRDDDFTIS